MYLYIVFCGEVQIYRIFSFSSALLNQILDFIRLLGESHEVN